MKKKTKRNFLASFLSSKISCLKNNKAEKKMKYKFRNVDFLYYIELNFIFNYLLYIYAI